MKDNIKAVIFDMDGTLIDSTGIWEIIDREFFKRRNMEVPPTYADEIAHIGLTKAAILTREKYGIDKSVEEIIKEWENASINEYIYNIPLKEGAKELLESLKNKGIRLALATANKDTLYIPCLKRLGIYDYFEIISDVEKVNCGKDSPKLYNYIADMMNIDHKDIAILEDSLTGLKTAYDAGYYAINVFDKASEKFEDEKKKCSYVSIHSLLELI